jgi:hypothetical protein
MRKRAIIPHFTRTPDRPVGENASFGSAAGTDVLPDDANKTGYLKEACKLYLQTGSDPAGHGVVQQCWHVTRSSTLRVMPA